MHTQNKTWIGIAVILLGLIGLGVSIYLSFKQISGTEIGTCPIFGTGCGNVLTSKYSSVFGIPLAYYGVLFYSLVIISGGLLLKTKTAVFRNIAALLALTGFSLSVVFIYIQGVLIGSYCFYCVISAITSTLLFFVMLPTLIDKVLDFTEKE